VVWGGTPFCVPFPGSDISPLPLPFPPMLWGPLFYGRGRLSRLFFFSERTFFSSFFVAVVLFPCSDGWPWVSSAFLLGAGRFFSLFWEPFPALGVRRGGPFFPPEGTFFSLVFIPLGGNTWKNKRFPPTGSSPTPRAGLCWIRARFLFTGVLLDQSFFSPGGVLFPKDDLFHAVFTGVLALISGVFLFYFYLNPAETSPTQPLHPSRTREKVLTCPLRWFYSACFFPFPFGGGFLPRGNYFTGFRGGEAFPLRNGPPFPLPRGLKNRGRNRPPAKILSGGGRGGKPPCFLGRGAFPF